MDLIDNVRQAQKHIIDKQPAPEHFQNWPRTVSQAEWAALRNVAGGWDVWRRLQDHHKLTGHSILKVPSLPITPHSN
jgi:hypothetical protein